METSFSLTKKVYFYTLNILFISSELKPFWYNFCLILFLSGTQMLLIAILGEYVSKDYMENKARPIYIVKDTNIK